MRGRPGRGLGTYTVGEGFGCGRRSDLQRLGQGVATCFVGAQSGAAVAGEKVEAHEAAVGRLAIGGEGKPAGDGFDGGSYFACVGLALGEAVEEVVGPAVYVLAAEGGPLIESGGVGKGEAFEKLAAAAPGCAEQGVFPVVTNGLLVGGGLHDVDVDFVFERGVEAQGVAFDEKMGGRLLFVVLKRAAEVEKGCAQGGAAGFTVAFGPEEGGQLLARVHAFF